MGRSRGGLTTKIHALVDAKGRPLRLLITPGQAHDAQGAAVLLSNLARKSIVVADKAYDDQALRDLLNWLGISKTRTFSFPKARTASTAVTAESIPPESPRMAILKFSF